jgi:YVTN family beta-propeller protein
VGRNLLYVTCQTGVVYVLSGASNQTTMTIPGFAFPIGVALDTADQLAYVANSTANTLAVVNTQKGAIIGTRPTGPQPWGVAFNQVTKHVYVTNASDSSVTVY